MPVQPSGMGALFEGSGEFQEKPFVVRSRSRAQHERGSVQRRSCTWWRSHACFMMRCFCIPVCLRQPRRAPPRPAAGAAGAPAAPAVSIFTILSELKCVLQQRTPAYEYFSHAPTEGAAAGAATEASQKAEDR